MAVGWVGSRTLHCRRRWPDLVQSVSKNEGEEGFRGEIRKMRGEREKEKKKSDLFSFSKLKFIVFSDFWKEISFLCILSRVFYS